MNLASTDGVTIALHDLGGVGEPLLICHATGMCARAYEPLAAELSDRFHVWALDFRAHGDATVPTNGRFDWSGFTDDLEVAVAAVTSEPLLAFGHSMGGATLALLEDRRPGTVRSAYLFEPVVIPSAEGWEVNDNFMSQSARRRRATFASKAEAMFRYAQRPPLGGLRADALAAYVEHGMLTLPDGTAQLKCAPENEAATFEATGKPNYDLMTRLTTPFTVGYGSLEAEEILAGVAVKLVEILPNGRADSQPLLGHFGPLENPRLIGRSVLAALAP